MYSSYSINMNEEASSHPSHPPYEKMAINNTVVLKKLFSEIYAEKSFPIKFRNLPLGSFSNRGIPISLF